MTSADVLLSDGRVAEIRTLGPGDGPAVHDLHERASDRSLWFRFFTAGRAPAHAYVDHVLSSPDTLSLVACIGDRMVGLATAEPMAQDAREIAFLVDDQLRGQGIGTLLLEHLAALARDRGIRTFQALVLAENDRMLDVFADAGFRVVRTRDAGECEVLLDIADTPQAQAAADAREFDAEARSLAPLLSPASVAVYGARRDGTGIGGAVAAAIVRGGFPGRAVAVHPQASDIGGLPATPSLAGGPPVDLAVIAVRAEHVAQALADAASGGVRAAVVISSGFGEMGEEGARLQRELGTWARRHGIRLVGPNCLGILDNREGSTLNASFGLRVPPPGGLAVASQSGGVGIALMDLMARAGVGVRSFVSLGNKVDVSSNDLLAAWYGDPEVSCAAFYLESFGNARKFARFARRFNERKPLVAVVGGRSSGGQRAGASHTAAAATPAVGVRALFAQAGVIGCEDAEQLAQTVTLLTREPVPAGRRLAVLSNAGGLGVLAADAAQDAGLDVVAFSEELGQRVAGMVQQTLGSSNPVDAGAGADGQRVSAIADTVLASGEVDALLVVLVATDTNDLDGALRTLGEVRRRHPARPVVVVPLGADPAGASPDVTVMTSATAALGALGRVAHYGEWRRTAIDDSVACRDEPSDPAAVRAAREVAARLLSGADDGDGWIEPGAAGPLLGQYGLAVVGEVAAGVDAPVVAERLGFPVAVKVAAADVVHRTELGLVRTDLRTAEEVRDAVTAFAARRGAPTSVLVQPMLDGVEIALGVVRDPSFGPLVMVAAGGVTTELSDDRVVLIPPFTAQDALRSLRGMRLWPVLDGFRGAPRADTAGLARMVADLGRLAQEVPELCELDANPVLVAPDGVHVVDVKVRLGVAAQRDLPRQLRPT